MKPYKDFKSVHVSKDLRVKSRIYEKFDFLNNILSNRIYYFQN